MIGGKVEHQEIFESSEVFQHLPTKVFRGLMAAGRIERYDHRTLLSARGERLEHLRYVIEGHIDVSLSTASGKSTGIPIFPGSWATWAGCFSEHRLSFELWSSKSAVLFAIPRHLLRSEVTRYPDALLKVIEHISEVNRFLIGWALGATLQSPERRLAYMLAVLSRRTSRIAGSRQASITQEQIGGLGFGSRQRVARLLQSLEQRGLVETSYGSVFVPSWEGLNAFALA